MHVRRAELGAVQRVHGLHDTAARSAIHEWNSQKRLSRQPCVLAGALVVLGVLRGVRRVQGLAGFEDPARDAMALRQTPRPFFAPVAPGAVDQQIAICGIRQ